MTSYGTRYLPPTRAAPKAMMRQRKATEEAQLVVRKARRMQNIDGVTHAMPSNTLMADDLDSHCFRWTKSDRRPNNCEVMKEHRVGKALRMPV